MSISVSIESVVELQGEPGDIIGLTNAMESVSQWLSEHGIKHVVLCDEMVSTSRVTIKLSNAGAASLRGWLISEGCPHRLRIV